MKRCSLFCLLLLWGFLPAFGQRSWQTKISSDHIRIEHSGPIDAPFRELIITMTKLKLDLMEREVLVHNDLFLMVAGFLETDALIGSSREVNEFGVFKVTKFVDGGGQVFFFPTRPKSISILQALKEEINDRSTSEVLVLEIEKILGRLDF